MNRRYFLNSLLALPPALALQKTKPSDDLYTALGHALDEPSGIISPESIRAFKVNQLGYLPRARKLAMFSASRPGRDFHVYHAGTSTIAFSGTLSEARFDADSGDHVQAADFTSLRQPGRYELGGPGLQRSQSFEIGNEIYRHAYLLAARFYYGQRCGTAVDLAPLFPQYKHHVCHLKAGYDPSSGRSGELHNRGGWHDAGDYGRYAANGGLSTASLLWAYELFAPAVGAISLHIPESGNGISDLLNEARWNLNWMMTLQDADGGVWHKQTSTHFAPFVMPENDRLASFVIGTGQSPYKCSAATGNLAAVAAIAARLFEPHHPAYARECLRAARKAWAWLSKNPDSLFLRNPAGIWTGAYGDPSAGDERFWAAAELFRTTGEEEFHNYFLENYAHYLQPELSAPNWGQESAMGLWTYALAPARRGRVVLRKDERALQAIRDASLRSADALVRRAEGNGYRTTMRASDYVWGSNSVVGNYGVQLLIASHLQPKPEYVDTALENLHYLLGRNPLSLSYVTQVGSHAVRRPHHRPSASDGVEAPWPGMLSGGPNRHRQDAAMRKYIAEDHPPMKNYIDNAAAYSCNEVAINWNAPLVFLLAGACAAKE